ncbi:hypothetical protein SPLA5a_PHROGS00106 [Salmonella phage SPLA5a]|nr:hypothetical protein SPLA5a_PHROGS00106 [Salmonella phage SPLA5a]
MMMTELNAREKLLAIADWLGWQNENLSFGLKSPEDAVKLYNYWQEHADSLSEMADDEQDDEGRWLFMFRKAALGYDPMGHDASILEALGEEKYDAENKDTDIGFYDIRQTVRKMYITDAEWKLQKEYGLV